MYSAWCNWSLSWDRFLLRSQACCQSHWQGSWLQGHKTLPNILGAALRLTPIQLTCLAACQLCWGLSLAVVLQWGARASGESCSTNKPLLNLTCSTMWWGLVCFEMCSRLAWHRYSLCQCTLLHNWFKKGSGRDLELYPAAFWDNMFWCPMLTCWFYVVWKIWLTELDATRSK